MSGPPAKPWVSGVHPTHKVFRLSVSLCEDEFGNIWSDHEFATSEDERVASGLRYGGVPQIAHAMLSEAVVREVYTSALLMFGKDPKTLERWATADEEGRKVIEAELAKAANHVITTTVPKMLPTLVPGVLAMLRNLLGASDSPAG